MMVVILLKKEGIDDVLHKKTKEKQKTKNS